MSEKSSRPMTVDTLLQSAERAAEYFNSAIEELEKNGIPRAEIVKGVDSVKGKVAKKILELALTYAPTTSTPTVTVPNGTKVEDRRNVLVQSTVKDEVRATSNGAMNGHEGNTSRMPILKGAISEISTLNISHEQKIERYTTVIRTELGRGVQPSNILNVYDGDLQLDHDVRTALQAIEADLRTEAEK